MEYLIKNEAGDTIASFKYEADRDYSLDALREAYEDCVLDAVNERG